jgi:membrane associated rhomboid family serine protease
MIPLRDTIPSQTWPIVNYTLIGINIFAFFIQLSKGPAMQTFVYTYGLVPARFTDADLRSYFSLGQQLLSLVTFMFCMADSGIFSATCGPFISSAITWRIISALFPT